MIEDLLVNGTSIQTLCVIEDPSGLYTSAPLRGSNYVLPGANGEVWTSKPYGAYGFSIGVAVLPVDSGGDDPATPEGLVAQWTSNWRALLELVDSSSAPLTLTRVLSIAEGIGSVTETCSAEVTGSIAPAMLGPYASRAVIDFWNLDGGWVEVGS